MAMTESKCTPERAVVIIYNLEKLPSVFHFFIGWIFNTEVCTAW